MGTEIDRYLAHYVGLGYAPAVAYPLVHPFFKHSYLPGPALPDMIRALNGVSTDIDCGARCVVQPSFRFPDAEKAGAGRHLSLFCMGAALRSGEGADWEQVLDPMLQFLIDEIGSAEGLCATVLGEPENGVESIGNTILRPFCTRRGLDPARIYPVGPIDGIWVQPVTLDSDSATWLPTSPVAPKGTSPTGRILGPRVEFFFDRGAAFTSAPPHSCSPACECGRFLELGSAVFPTLFRTGDTERSYAGPIEGAIGLERVAMIKERAPTVWDTRALASVLAAARSAFTAIDPADLLVFLDCVRSFACLTLAHPEVKPSGRGIGKGPRMLADLAFCIAGRATLDGAEAACRTADFLCSEPAATAPFDLAAGQQVLMPAIEHEYDNWCRNRQR